MKKLLFSTFFLAFVIVVPVPAMAQVSVNINVAPPPPIEFAAPPEMVVLPGTYVYIVPGVAQDIFFYNGWWWRPWGGRWYRSLNYNSGWGYYRSVPSFYGGIPPAWRNDYREHRWGGQPWNYQRISHQQLQQNWKGWQTSKHWEKQNAWGVQGMKPQTRSQSQTLKQQDRGRTGPQQYKPQQGKHEKEREERHERR
jgi:hypothetical protein